MSDKQITDEIIRTPIITQSAEESVPSEHLWQNKDTLRSMTSKYNAAVTEFTDNISQLSKDTQQVNEATEEKFKAVDKSISEMSESLSKKIEDVTAEDIGLGNVDNTSDLDKPVSKAQQEAIDAAIDKFADEFTQEVPGEDPIGDDPEVSTPVKEYIDDKIKDAVAKVSIGIASTTVLGGIKVSDDIKVDPKTGVATVPAISEFSSIKESLKSNNEATQKLIDNTGEIETLETTDKTLVGAINEVFQLGSERKETLVENLTAMGVTCSTDEDWPSLLSKVLKIATGTDTSSGDLVAANLLYGKVGFGAKGKVVGTMPNRSVTSANGGQGEDIVGVSWPDQAINHSTLTQYAKYGRDNTEKLIMRPPTGYYDETVHARVYANPNEVATAIGLTAEKLLKGKTVCGVTGTGSQFSLIQQNTGGEIIVTWHGWDELQKYDAVMVQFYDQASFANADQSKTTANLIYSFCMTYSEMIDNMNRLDTLENNQIFNIYVNSSFYGNLTLNRTQGLKVVRNQARFGYRILGITGFDTPARNYYTATL